MRLTDDMVGKIHAVDCVEFTRSLKPNWADAVMTGPSANLVGRWRKRERRWMVNFARALKFGGTLMLFGVSEWCEKQRYSLGRAGFDVIGVSTVPESSHAGREVLVACLGDGLRLIRKGSPWHIQCSRVQWGSSVPIEECVEILETYTKPGDLVFDPFMGMGTTAMACERTGRRWVGCEVSAGRAGDAMRRIERDREDQREIDIINQSLRGRVVADARLKGIEDAVQG